MTTALLLLRAVKLGISIQDLELITIGMLEDMCIESAIDHEDRPMLASQEDFDRF